jgi:hypothetical protein
MYTDQLTPWIPETDLAHETPKSELYPYICITGGIFILDNIDTQLRIDLVDSVLDCLIHGADL